MNPKDHESRESNPLETSQNASCMSCGELAGAPGVIKMPKGDITLCHRCLTSVFEWASANQRLEVETKIYVRK